MTSEVKQKVGKAMVPIMAIYALGASQGGINAGLATMALVSLMLAQISPMSFLSLLWV